MINADYYQSNAMDLSFCHNLKIFIKIDLTNSTIAHSTVR